jgi:hypothetical protein
VAPAGHKSFGASKRQLPVNIVGVRARLNKLYFQSRHLTLHRSLLITDSRDNKYGRVKGALLAAKPNRSRSNGKANKLMHFICMSLTFYVRLIRTGGRRKSEVLGVSDDSESWEFAGSGTRTRRGKTASFGFFLGESEEFSGKCQIASRMLNLCLICGGIEWKVSRVDRIGLEVRVAVVLKKVNKQSYGRRTSDPNSMCNDTWC